MEKEVLYKKDVLEEVAKRLGLTLQQVEYNYKGLVHVLHQILQDPEVATIHIPKIGKMRFNAGLATHIRRGYEERELVPSQRLKNIFKKLQNMENDPNLRRRTYYNRSKLRNTFYTKGLRRKEMEEKQNKSFNEHKKRYNNS